MKLIEGPLQTLNCNLIRFLDNFLYFDEILSLFFHKGGLDDTCYVHAQKKRIFFNNLLFIINFLVCH